MFLSAGALMMGGLQSTGVEASRWVFHSAARWSFKAALKPNFHVITTGVQVAAETVGCCERGCVVRGAGAATPLAGKQSPCLPKHLAGVVREC